MAKYKSYKAQPQESWHLYSINEIIYKLETSFSGLTPEEAKNRLVIFGPNEIEKHEKLSPLKIFLSQFTNLLILILIVATGIALYIGEDIEAIAILMIIILAGFLGFFQEYHAEKSIDSLRKLASPTATVIRNGEEHTIQARELVPGDIITVRTGDKVPADARLIEVRGLKVDESILTGESDPPQKTSDQLTEQTKSIGDRFNMLFAGTSVVSGYGRAIVTSTGMSTEFGRIANILQTAKPRKTPLQNDLDRIGKFLGIASIIIALVISAFGVMRGYQIVEMFIWGIALAVAIIPEALPAVVTISLSIGVRRMARRKALICKLPVVETLGATTVICTDKTGTLTQNEMTVHKIYSSSKIYTLSGTGYVPKGKFYFDNHEIDPNSDPNLLNLLIAGVLCNDAVLKRTDGSWEITGDPTEGGILVAAAKAGIFKEELLKSYPRTDEVTFSSERKRMTTIHKTPNGYKAYSKGALEVILSSCSYIYKNNELCPLTDDDRNHILDVAHKIGLEALRILGFSEKYSSTEKYDENSIENDMIFLGFVGMLDPPRPSVIKSIELCKLAGIKTVMVTGDHKATAMAIAKELKIMQQDKEVLTGDDLDQITDNELMREAENISVYARISPEHKMRIVCAYINNNHVVAMTGDGINDAPALKKADIGVAMGISGTEVSKEASDMILIDDNFSSIVAAIEEGRSIFENIRKYLIFLLSGNLGTVFGMTIALLLSLPLPLTAVQILFVNFLMDGLIALALGLEPPEPGIMKKKPRNINEGILNVHALRKIFSISLWIALITTSVFLLANRHEHYTNQQAMTLFFSTLIFSRFFNGINCRSMHDPIYKLGIFTNRPLILSSIIAIALTLLVVYVPILQKAFNTVYIEPVKLIIIFLLSSSVLIVGEIEKLLKSKFFKRSVNYMY